MTDQYFDEHIALREKTVREWQDEMLQYKNKDAAQFSVFQYCMHLVPAYYSRGNSIFEIKNKFLAALEAWETLKQIDVDKQFVNSLKNGLNDYVNSIGLLSQAYLLDMEPVIIARLLACIGSEGQDLLFEQLVAQIAPALVRKSAKKLLYPKVYQLLYDALNASADQQSVLVQQFLKDWYKGIKVVGWHNSHKGPGGGGFFGYWCWEAAGVAHAFGIDDSSFHDMPYYPKDLADFGQAAGKAADTLRQSPRRTADA